jgi:hypothetical protein
VPAFVIPRDGAGNVAPHDHPDLQGDNRVIRRISEQFVVPSANGGRRLSSAVFKNDPRQGYLSLDSEKCILDLPDEPATYVITPVWVGALIISCAQFRSAQEPKHGDAIWKIGMVPVDGNDCHAGAWGKITAGNSNELQRRSDWLVPIPGVEKLAAA